MAATSHDFWLLMLTPRSWKALHMAVYVAYALVVMHVALGYLQDAWMEARLDAIEGDCLAQTALFLAFAELISTYGEEAAARYAETLGERIRNGEFSVELSRQ